MGVNFAFSNYHGNFINTQVSRHNSLNHEKITTFTVLHVISDLFVLMPYMYEKLSLVF